MGLRPHHGAARDHLRLFVLQSSFGVYSVLAKVDKVVATTPDLTKWRLEINDIVGSLVLVAWL